MDSSSSFSSDDELMMNEWFGFMNGFLYVPLATKYAPSFVGYSPSQLGSAAIQCYLFKMLYFWKYSTFKHSNIIMEVN